MARNACLHLIITAPCPHTITTPKPKSATPRSPESKSPGVCLLA